MIVGEDEDADEDAEWSQMMADHDLTPTNHDLAASASTHLDASMFVTSAFYYNYYNY